MKGSSRKQSKREVYGSAKKAVSARLLYVDAQAV